MTAGGGRHPGDDDGLGAFASERDEPSAPLAAPRSTARHALESPRLVPIVVALAVVGYGGLMVVWWERDTPEVKPSYSSAPTTSFRPSAPPPTAPPSAPEPARSTAAAPRVAVQPSAEVPDDVFFPAVARGTSAPRPADAGAPVAEPLSSPLAEGADEDVAEAAPIAPVVAEVAPPPAPAVADAAIAAPVLPNAPSVVDRVTADRTAIGDVLQSYRAAYNALDATSVSTIWQGLDTRALQKAFATLSQQRVAFDRCEVRLTAADHAVASCRGVLSYVPKIGDGTPQQRRLSWNFDFQRAADRWLISGVSAR